MILNNEKTTNNSIIQTAYTYFCDCLASFKEMQPDFDYTVNYGTNSNDDDILEDKNKFNFVVYTGIPELIPSHWMEINGQSEILYAGSIDIAVSVVNPIPLNYNNDFTLERIEGEEYVDSTYSQEDYNEISDEDNNKIDFGIRMLEALSRFLIRKGIVYNGFKLTSDCAVPSPDGLFENGFYRLQTVLDISIKFAMLNALGSSLTSGEDTRLWIKIQNNDYKEIYNVLDATKKLNAVDKSFPLFSETTLKTKVNQINRIISIDFPQLDFGGNKAIVDVLDSGDLSAINNMSLVMYDGKKYVSFGVVPVNIETPYTMNKFNGVSVVFNITTDVTEFEGDLNA